MTVYKIKTISQTLTVTKETVIKTGYDIEGFISEYVTGGLDSVISIKEIERNKSNAR